jgi:hypothetical protein
MNRLVLIFAVLCLLPGVHAQSCSEVTQEIRNINSNAFIDYPLLNDVKQDILLMMYGRERGSCPSNVREFAELSRDFITDFDEAYVYANSDLSEDNLKAVTLTRTLKNEADSLSAFEGVFGVEGDDLIISAHQVVEDFLVLQADTYAKEAGATEVTIRKIQFYKTAALAYESAGNSLESSNNNIKASVLEENYYQDLKYANSLYTSAVEEHSDSKSLAGGDVFSKIRAYVLSRSSLLDFEEAKAYFSYHHETEKITQIENMEDKVKLTRQALVRELVIYFGGVALLLTALAMFMVNRINVWKSDSDDHLLGNELVQVSKNET